MLEKELEGDGKEVAGRGRERYKGGYTEVGEKLEGGCREIRGREFRKQLEDLEECNSLRI